jgi:twitching motility protein PilI
MARRTDLRKFQEELARRIASADRAASAGRRLAFRAGSASWLVALPDAGEVLPVPALTSVPLTRGWVRGLANVRGNLYTVVDLAAFVGDRPTPAGPRNRLLLVGQRHAMNSALLVDLVVGLRDVGDLASRALDTSTQPWIKAAYADRDGTNWQELDVPALLQGSHFLDVAA